MPPTQRSWMYSELTAAPFRSKTNSCACEQYYIGVGQRPKRSSLPSRVRLNSHLTVTWLTGQKRLGSRTSTCRQSRDDIFAPCWTPLAGWLRSPFGIMTPCTIAQRMRIWWIVLPMVIAVSDGAQPDWTDKSPHKPGFLVVNGVKLHYLDWGGKGEPLLLLHGMGDTPHVYDVFAPKFTNQLRVLGLTRRGHGESEIPETGYDTATLVEDIRQFLDALRIDRVILAGHSFAGDELTRFAVVHPDRVIKLIYFDSAYDHSRVPESLRFKPLHGGGLENLPTKEENESPDGVRRWISRLFGEKRGRAIYSMMEGSYSATADYRKIMSPALAFFVVGYQKDVDRAERLPEPQRKAALEFLKTQRKYHAQEIEHFRREIPDGRVIVFTNGDHNCFIDRENEVIGEMRAFLAK